VTWITDNWKILFSGVLGTAVVAVIGHYLREWHSSRKVRVPASLTAQGARVDRTAVASGATINQTIGDTHHHHYPSPNPPETSEAVPAAEPETVRANIKITGCRTVPIRTGLDGSFYQPDAIGAGDQACIVAVTNDARRAGPNIGATVKATLIFRDGQQEILRGMGCWLGQLSGYVQFRVDDSYNVVVSVRINANFSVPTKRRVVYGVGHVSFPTDPNYLEPDRMTVAVRLTDGDTGDLYDEKEFEVSSNPLGISEAAEIA
jgi:hypothetical protein